MVAQPLLRVDDLAISFGLTQAVDGVDLELADGEVLALLGPSGCGKSTLLRSVAGLQPLDRGAVSLDGVNITDRPPHARQIGLMFQEHTLFPHRNVSENVAFGLRMTGRPEAERSDRVADLLDLVGLAGFERREVATLSGGEAQRVALARTLAPGPRLVLLDEPLGSLDRARRDQLIDDLPRVLAATGTGAIHVTHDHDEAFAVADRVAVMESGRVRQIGRPLDVWQHPVDETVARFLGHTNVVDGPRGRQVIRIDAARLDPAGAIEIDVERVRFQGHQWELTGRSIELGPLRFVFAARPPNNGSVRLTLDPDAVIDLT